MRTFYWHEKKNLDLSRFFLLIGVTRLELATSWSLTRRANQTTLHPEINNKIYAVEGT